MAKKVKISEAAKDLKLTAKELAAFLEEKVGGKKTSSSSMTEEEYRESLIERAREKASEYVHIHNVEFDADANAGAVYLQDYDLGDKCDIIIDDVHRSYEASIVESLETWSKGVHQVTLTFGDKIPTIYEKARLR